VPESGSQLDSATARVKVVDPLATIGPSTPPRILSSSDTGLSLEMRREVLPGSLLHVRTRDRIFLGRVHRCVPLGTEFEIAVQIVETF
jgi:hypothetical protein